MKKIKWNSLNFKSFLETFLGVSIVFLLAFLMRTYLIHPFYVLGDSMIPNFHNHDYLLIDKLSYRFRDTQRGEVIVFAPSWENGKDYIKRIVGIPGDSLSIKDGAVYLKTKEMERFSALEENYLLEGQKTGGEMEVTLGEGEYFVLGDNRSNSADSRGSFFMNGQQHVRLVEKEDIIGRVLFRCWPISDFGFIAVPELSYADS